MTKVYRVGSDDKRTELARFDSSGADWKDSDFKKQMEDNGVWNGSKVLFPKDGEPFLEAMGIAFSQSSRILVTTE